MPCVLCVLQADAQFAILERLQELCSALTRPNFLRQRPVQHMSPAGVAALRRVCAQARAPSSVAHAASCPPSAVTFSSLGLCSDGGRTPSLDPVGTFHRAGAGAGGAGAGDGAASEVPVWATLLLGAMDSGDASALRAAQDAVHAALCSSSVRACGLGGVGGGGGGGS